MDEDIEELEKEINELKSEKEPVDIEVMVKRISEPLTPTVAKSYEFPILRKALKELIDNEKDYYKVKMLFAQTMGLGGESPEMMQLHAIEEEVRKKLDKFELLLNDKIQDQNLKIEKWKKIVMGLGSAVAFLTVILAPEKAIEVVKILLKS